MLAFFLFVSGGLTGILPLILIIAAVILFGIAAFWNPPVNPDHRCGHSVWHRSLLESTSGTALHRCRPVLLGASRVDSNGRWAMKTICLLFLLPGLAFGQTRWHRLYAEYEKHPSTRTWNRVLVENKRLERKY